MQDSPPYRDHLHTLIRRSGVLQVCPAFPETPADVVLCVAGCLLDLRDLRPSIPTPLLPRTILYHLSDGAGPLIAGLLGFHGYLPRDASEERILRCLGRVAGGEIDAPPPHLDILLGALQSPPITPRDYEILHRLALGQTHDRIGGGVGLSTRAVDAHIAELKELFGVESTCALVAVTVGLGLVSPFRDAPPIVWLSDKRVGGGGRRRRR